MFGDIRNAQGERLDTTFHPGHAGRKDLVVIGHGVTANKDRPFLQALAEGISATGRPALRFSFSGNGESEGEFVDSCVSKEVEDLGSVIDAVDGFRVAYAGHSMGAAVGVLRASRDDRIEALISLAGMVHTESFAQRKFGDQKPGESFMWDKPECPLSQHFMDDMKAIGSVARLGSEIQVPWLLVHGTGDTVVPLQDALDIWQVAGNKPELVKLDGADHVFTGGAAGQMVQAVTHWLDRHWKPE
ncbi:MAG: prolyl oligopeptidase family serine peptidase [Planctomycetota bacterium]